MSIYLTREKRNRIKICCIEDKNFEIGVNYIFTFKSYICCQESSMVLQGELCGVCAEFYFDEGCDVDDDIELKKGSYSLEVKKESDDSILYSSTQVRVQ